MVNLARLQEVLDRLNALYGKGRIEKLVTNQTEQYPATRGYVIRRMQYGIDRKDFDIFSKGLRGMQVRFLHHTKIFK